MNCARCFIFLDIGSLTYRILTTFSFFTSARRAGRKDSFKQSAFATLSVCATATRRFAMKSYESARWAIALALGWLLGLAPLSVSAEPVAAPITAPVEAPAALLCNPGDPCLRVDMVPNVHYVWTNSGTCTTVEFYMVNYYPGGPVVTLVGWGDVSQYATSIPGTSGVSEIELTQYPPSHGRVEYRLNTKHWYQPV